MSHGKDITSGETPGHRGAIDRMTKQLVDSGSSPENASQKAREAAVRHDRRNNR